MKAVNLKLKLENDGYRFERDDDHRFNVRVPDANYYFNVDIRDGDNCFVVDKGDEGFCVGIDFSGDDYHFEASPWDDVASPEIVLQLKKAATELCLILRQEDDLIQIIGSFAASAGLSDDDGKKLWDYFLSRFYAANNPEKFVAAAESLADQAGLVPCREPARHLKLVYGGKK